SDKIISAILKSQSEAEDSFVTLEQAVLNSCKKNKEAKFDADKKLMSATPRRETYTVDSPMTCLLANKQESIIMSASPVLKEISSAEARYITVNRGSERKSKCVSFVTPLRRSPRIASLSSPNYTSVKDRPKTPVPSRMSSAKRKVNFADISDDNADLDKNKGSGLRPKVKRPSTPMPKRRKTVDGSDFTKDLTPNSGSTVKMAIAQQKTPSSIKQEDAVSPSKSGSHKKVILKMTETLSKQKDAVLTSKSGSHKKAVMKMTPNFKKIHEKAFEKMESIEEYSKRKTEHSAKKIKDQISLQEKLKSHQKKKVQKKGSKIPKPFAGIPFIPSIKSTRRMNLNFGSSGTSNENAKRPAEKISHSVNKKLIENTSDSQKVAATGNISMNRKSKFDLKASLSRKLPYKPYTGPLKPLTENNLNCSIQPKEVIQQKRIESRNVLRGVRKNKRFELQMKNRNV
ncbi:nucleolar and spindle-associated protein 1-like, partial [Stegodyphus dumicola]|uniref:nucleolar and spindle-associated protein 1-like n=1 Tax=Stegodyphus dumicola TaxID=202533 RepID=UPI0015B367E7